ncbi:MAG: penicillin-binding transpeptidase domain-containing protein, partial [Polyangiales bacterium]
VVDGTTVVYKAPLPSSIRKAIEPATAIDVGKMMTETVSQGTCYKAFHDAKGKAFIPGVEIAGKTGTLNQPSPLKLFTWFVGFAPAKNPKVAIAVLVVNDPVWKVKANVVAREVLQTYFAEQGTPGVVAPSTD